MVKIELSVQELWALNRCLEYGQVAVSVNETKDGTALKLTESISTIRGKLINSLNNQKD